MPSPDNPSQPHIMIGFAGADRPAAKELQDAFVLRGIDTFIDEATPSGHDIMRTINEAIAQRDYFVLLWSGHCIDNRYVEAEYYAAMMRGLTERRPFLHVVRLDDTPPPVLLAPIRYLDADADLEAIADRLVATWEQGRELDPPIPTIDIHVHNEDLSIAHLVSVPAQGTVQHLKTAVCLRLGLKAQVTAFDGQVGARFSYRIELDERQLAEELPLATAGVTDNSRVYLGVRVAWFGPRSLAADATFRNGESAGVSPTTKQKLLQEAFGHLSRQGAQPIP